MQLIDIDAVPPQPLQARLARLAQMLGPGIALVLTASSVNIIGDWLFERLSGRGAVR